MNNARWTPYSWTSPWASFFTFPFLVLVLGLFFQEAFDLVAQFPYFTVKVPDYTSCRLAFFVIFLPGSYKTARVTGIRSLLFSAAWSIVRPTLANSKSHSLLLMLRPLDPGKRSRDPRPLAPHPPCAYRYCTSGRWRWWRGRFCSPCSLWTLGLPYKRCTGSPSPGWGPLSWTEPPGELSHPGCWGGRAEARGCSLRLSAGHNNWRARNKQELLTSGSLNSWFFQSALCVTAFSCEALWSYF